MVSSVQPVAVTAHTFTSGTPLLTHPDRRSTAACNRSIHLASSHSTGTIVTFRVFTCMLLCKARRHDLGDAKCCPMLALDVNSRGSRQP